MAGRPIGSSPRVRGILSGGVGGRAEHRFIPAGAGNTRPSGVQAVYESGSSPRVRGIRDLVGIVGGFGRFIPAGAGNTAGGAARPAGNTVHPRGCGEY